MKLKNFETLDSNNLLIVFVKNIILGKVKTRLAKTIGDLGAFAIYSELFAITEKESQKVEIDRHIYFSDVIIPSKWEDDEKFVQEGENLGEKMLGGVWGGMQMQYYGVV